MSGYVCQPHLNSVSPAGKGCADCHNDLIERERLRLEKQQKRREGKELKLAANKARKNA